MENQLPLSDDELLELLTLTVEVDEIGTRRWRNKDGQLHRVYGQAVEYADGGKVYFFNGKRHRTAGPAIERTDGYKAWYKNGELHRNDGPAIEVSDGYVEWYRDGERVDPF